MDHNHQTLAVVLILTVLWLLVPPPMLLCEWAGGFQCSCMSRCVHHTSANEPHTLCTHVVKEITSHGSRYLCLIYCLLIKKKARLTSTWDWQIWIKLAVQWFSDHGAYDVDNWRRNTPKSLGLVWGGFTYKTFIPFYFFLSLQAKTVGGDMNIKLKTSLLQ